MRAYGLRHDHSDLISYCARLGSRKGLQLVYDATGSAIVEISVNSGLIEVTR